jgi:hypothetical protein
MKPRVRPSPSQIVFWIGCALCVMLEAYLFFIDRHGTFTIAGFQTYEVAEFARGMPVSHAFLMQGEGLNAVNVQLASRTRAEARIEWTLWQGISDAPPLLRAAGGERTITVGPGRTWARFEGPRDGSSNNRWYTIEVRLLDAHAAGTPSEPADVRIMATADNPDRGGVLWYGATRKSGSLLMSAERVGRTRYRHFRMEQRDNLPPALRSPFVLWAFVVAGHWAFFVAAGAILRDGRLITPR